MDQFVTQIPTTALGWVGLAALVISAGLYIRNSDTNSIRQSANDLRLRLDDKDKENRDLQSQIDALGQELAKLRGVLEEKDKRIDALTHINITSSPEFTAYMTDMRNFTNQVHLYMTETTKTLGEIKGSK